MESVKTMSMEKESILAALSSSGAYDWAKTTLKEHAKDKRSHVYSRQQLEEAKTHDDLWNAAQVGPHGVVTMSNQYG